MLAKLKDHDVSSLRKCVSAGEPLPKGHLRRLARRDRHQADGRDRRDRDAPHLHRGAEDEIRPGATGKPVPGYEAKVLDEEGRELPPGRLGRLAVRGPTGCRYLEDERQRKYVQNGWNITGDTYLMDEDGYFWYQARSDDMIVSAGYNIAGPEVEAALLTHPAVAECGVVGAPDDDRGMIVKAYVVLHPGHAPGADLTRALQEHVKAEIAPYKYPRVIEVVDALPRTQTGKLQRFELRRMADRGHGGLAPISRFRKRTLEPPHAGHLDGRNDRPTVLQPSGWPRPKGYANGMAAEGRIVVTGGVVGWDESGVFPDGFVAQARQTLLNIRAILAEAGAEPHPSHAPDLVRGRHRGISREPSRARPRLPGGVGHPLPGDGARPGGRPGGAAARVEIEATAVVPR